MEKKIIALAIAGLVSGAAYAQTNVTLYGKADLGYTYSKSDFSKFQGIESGTGISGGASRIGVRGEEALGNGLKAVFNFEWGLNADEGQGPTTPRWAFVGLAGGFGTVVVGRNRTPSDVLMGGTAAHGLNSHEPAARFRAQMAIIDGVRWNNSISYTSPNFSGLDFMAIYSFGEKVNKSKNTNGYDCVKDTSDKFTCYEGADTSDAGQLGLGVRYANGPLYLAAVYHLRKDDDSSKIKTYDNDPFTGYNDFGYGAKGWGIGGSYDFKVVKVYANYFRAKANHGGLAAKAEADIFKASSIAVDAGSDKQTAWSIGVGIPVSSAGTVSVEYAQYKDYLGGSYSDSGQIIGATRYATTVGDPGDKAKGYTVGYNHVLSKRTALYAYVSRFDNDRGIDAGWAKTGVAGEKQTNFSIGVNHNF